MSFLGLFGDDDGQPKFNQPNIDPKTQTALTAAVSNHPHSDSEYADALMRNTGSGGLLNSNQLGQEEHSLGMLSDESQRQAISNKSNRLYQSEMDNLTRRAQIHGYQKAAQTAASDQALIEKQDAYNLKLTQARVMSRLNEQAARNSVLGDVLGAVGMVGGAALGAAGGPAGAMMGMNLGKNVASGFAGSGKESEI